MIRRAHRRGAVALSALALLAGGCIPVTPPPPPPALTFCMGASPTSPDGYRNAFAGIRNSDREWVLGDNAYPVTLPDRRIVWIFADTILGRVTGDVLAPTRSLVHSSFVVQSGACFTPVMAGVRGARTSLIPNPAPGEWIWPFTGAVDPSRNVLLVFGLRLRTSTSPPPFNFAFAGFDVATFSLPGLKLLDRRPIAGLSTTVGVSRQYLPNWNTGGLAIGTYFYGFGRDGNTPQGHIGTNQHFLARAPLASIATSPWEYFTGLVPSAGGPDQPSWSTNPADAKPVPFVLDPSYPAGATNPSTYLQVIPHGSGFLAAGKLSDLVSNDISTWQAPTVAGPWTYNGRAATVPVLSYCARITTDLPGGPVAQWCPFGFNDRAVSTSALQFTTPAAASLTAPG